MVLGTILTGLHYGKKAYDWWQDQKKDTSGIAGKFARTAGNFIQRNLINKMDDGFLKYGAEALNKTFLNPKIKPSYDDSAIHIAHNNNSDNGALKSESHSSPNAVLSGGEGSLYNSKPGARNPYDYASTDFESILRKQMNRSIPKVRRFNKIKY